MVKMLQGRRGIIKYDKKDKRHTVSAISEEDGDINININDHYHNLRGKYIRRSFGGAKSIKLVETRVRQDLHVIA